jgi:hypothetical protein
MNEKRDTICLTKAYGTAVEHYKQKMIMTI